jgi:hypothetical protein
MTKDLITAANLLAETLEAENGALSVLDLPRAGAMLERKQRALADLAAAAQILPVSRDPAERVARRLQALAMENKRLPERAICAQGRVIGVVARAAAPAMAPTSYGAARPAGRPAALALLARA